MNKLKKSSILGKIILIIMSLFLGVSLISINYFTIGKSEINNNDFNFNNYFAITDSNNAIWKLYQDEISGEVTGEDGTCGSSTKKGTLTLTYTNDDDCTLSFDLILNLNGGTFQLNGNSIQTNGSNKVELKKGEKLTFYLESKKGNYTSKVNIKNIKCAIKKEITLTFKKPENGTYTVNKKEITLDETINTSATNVFNLEAKPLDGYDFYGWMFNDSIFSFKSSFEYYFTENTIVYPFFTKKESPLFLFENNYYDDLNEVLSKANLSTSATKEIKLVKSGTIKNPDTTEIVYDFNGVNLAIPSGEENLSTYDTPLFGTSKKTNELYRKLVIDDDIVLNFRSNSSLIVNTEFVYAASGGQTGGGSPQGKYGQIHLNGENSKIIFDNGSCLYAYGYITGTGIVNAKNRSTITELFQINDFRGGSATLKMGNKVFPFNQYYVQNIECHLRLETGATEKVITALYALGGTKIANFKFVSTITSSEASLFKLSNNSILSRYYDYNKDKILYELEEGSADISPISLKVAGTSVNAADYTLPITNNMELKLKANTSVNINQELCFSPGSKITIEDNSTLTISKGYKIYLYDKNSWVGKFLAFHGDISEILYSPTKNYKRTVSDLYNVIVNVNGKLNIESGAGVFTTYDGKNYANIFSSNGTGEVSYNGTPLSETNTYQYDKSANKHTLSVMQLALRNSREEIESSNDSFLKLSEGETLNDSTYYFSISESKWLKRSSATNAFKITFFDSTNNLNVIKQYTVNEDFVFPSSDEEEFLEFKLNNKYKVKKWRIEGVGIFEANETTKLTTTKDLSAIPIYGGWYIDIDNSSKYYLDFNSGEKYKGLMKVDYNNSIQICYFDESTGIFRNEFTGMVLNDNDMNNYFVQNGVVKEKGFYKYLKEDSSNDYNYVFVSDDNSLLKSGTFYVNIDDKTSSILPSGTYNFDANGLIIKEDKDTSSYNEDNVYVKNIDNNGDSAFINGIRVGIGLFKDGNYLKYADSTGFIVKNTTYYVSKTNNINDIKEGLYYFDNEGRMYDESFTLIEAK